ncbi:MAG: hypothetical protein ACFFDQ_11795 [Candidatus Thorarchaeota archaeon]
MLAAAITSFGKTIVVEIAPQVIERRKLEEYKDDSIELRRYLAATSANKQFEQRKDRALTDVHRAGFMR